MNGHFEPLIWDIGDRPMNALRTFVTRGLFGAVVAAGMATGAQAVSLSFNVNFDDGALSGQSFTGSFTVDDLTGTGFEIFTPEGTAGIDKLTAFSISIDGTTFGITDDIDYPEYPEVQFINGVFDYIDFLSDDLSIVDNFVEYIDGSTSSTGTVSSVSLVPLPAGGFLLIGGLAALTAAGRRRSAA